MPGPAPKRAEQRRRTATPKAGEPRKAKGAAKVVMPPADNDWHPIARAWYLSLGDSGQSQFYEPSDWQTAYVVAESMSREFNPQPVVIGRGEDAHIEMISKPPTGSAQMAWLKAMSTLLVMEGDRRRVALELQRPKSETVENEG